MKPAALKNSAILARAASLIVIYVGALPLIGVAYDLPWLKQMIPMSLVTATGLIISNLTLLLHVHLETRPKARRFEAIFLLLASVPIVLGIKWFPHYPAFSVGETSGLILAGVSLILLRHPVRSFPASAWCALMLLIIPLTSLVGRFFGVPLFVPDISGVGLTFPTIIALIAFSFALLSVQPNFAPANLLLSETTGGTLARRLIVLYSIVPLVVGGTAWFVSLTEGTDPRITRAVAVIVTFTVAVFVTTRITKILDQEEKRQRAEEDRHRAHDKILLTTLESIPTAVWILDWNGDVLRRNLAAERLIPAPKDILDKPGWVGRWIPSGEILKPNDWPLARLIREGKVSINKLIEFEMPTGTRKILLNSAYPVRDDHGLPIGVVLTCVDVTTNFRLQKELGVLTRVGEVLIQLGPTETKVSRVAKIVVPEVAAYCAVFTFDEDGRLQWIGEACDDEPRAMDFQRILHTFDSRGLEAIGIDTALRRQRSLIVSKTMAADRVEHGQLFSFIVSPIIIHHGAIGAMVLLRADPIHPYAKEEKFVAEGMARLFGFAIQNERSAEQLKRAVRAREDVVAIVSHDLRNPLDVVINGTALAEEEVARYPEVAAKIEDLLRMIGAAGERMHGLIQDLLDVSRIEAGRLEIQSHTTDLVSLIEENVSFMRTKAEKAGLSLRFTPPRNLPPVACDSARISQTLGNLITNAIKFTPPGGSIEVTLRDTPHHGVEISVRDTGSGIKKEHLCHIFERYWQPRESAQKGVGLGLFIVKGIVEAHGGRIWVTSQEGAGSTFTFTLPNTTASNANSHHGRHNPSDFPLSQTNTRAKFDSDHKKSTDEPPIT